MDQGLEQALRTQSVDHVLREPVKQTTLKHVDWASSVLSQNIDTAHYKLLLSPDMGPRNVAVLFPLNANRPLLWAHDYRSLGRWQRAINDALDGSLDEGGGDACPRLAVAHGKHVYVCRGLTGRLYLFWAALVHRGNRVLGEQMPLLINTDGALGIKGLMLLHPRVDDPSHAERLPITVASPTLMWDAQSMHGHPFVCDVRRVSLTTTVIPRAMRESEARQELTRAAAPLSADAPMLVHNHFERSLDYEDAPARPGLGTSSEDTNSSGYTFDPDTPRGTDCVTPRGLRFTTPIILDDRQ